MAGALDHLAPRKRELVTAWRRDLGKLWPQERGADVWKIATRIPRMNFRSFQREIDTMAKELAKRQVPFLQILGAIHRLTESLTASLRPDSPWTIDVLRLSGVIQALFMSSYCEQQRARLRVLQTQQNAAEKRQLGASAYVTNVYEQERRGLSHDLHDDIGHDLVMLKLHLELSSTDLEQRNVSAVRQRLDAARVLVGHTIESVRRMVLDLGPTVFDDLGFVPTIRYYVRRFSTSTDIDVSIEEGNLPGDIPISHQIALYRILQGALSNVLKHARAKHVKVALVSLKDSVLMMTVEDDGIGFDTAAIRTGRFGLTAMRERVAVLGGKVHIQSWRAGPASKRHGTRIEVDLPLPGAGRS